MAWRQPFANGETAVVVTVAAAKGSTPREAGTKMAVGGDQFRGTIGGGNLEFRALRLARAMLDPGAAATRVEAFPLGPRLGQCCGGHATLVFERLEPGQWLDAFAEPALGHQVLTTIVTGPRAGAKSSRAATVEDDDRPAAEIVAGSDGDRLIERPRRCGFHIALFGAGHVGQALIQVLGLLPCRVTWIDERDGIFPAAVPGNVAIVHHGAPEDMVAELEPGAYVLVMSHSHARDYAICEQALARRDLAYCGLIGSAAKRARFEARMRAKGWSATDLARLTSPIGLAGVGGKQPGEIAVAVAAELLTLRAAEPASRAAPARRSA